MTSVGEATQILQKWHDCHFSKFWQSCHLWHDGRVDTEPSGRREANKQATRNALRDAAARLFAVRGYEATTVAQISEAAGVGERTFYRYFDSKDALLTERALAWVEELSQAIRDRPAEEGPYLAVSRALGLMAGQLTTEAGNGGFWTLTDAARPLSALRSAVPAPLRRLERSIADALERRAHVTVSGLSGMDPAPDVRHQAILVARAAVAVLRTAVERHRSWAGEGQPSPGIEELVRCSFAELAQLSFSDYHSL